MVRRDQNRGKNRKNRPAATLDLKAEKVSSEVDGADKDTDSLENEASSAVENKMDHSSDKPNEGKDDDQSALSSAETDNTIENGNDGSSSESKDDDKGPELTAEQISQLVLSQQKPRGSFFKTMVAAIIGAGLALVGQQFMPQLVTFGEIQNSTTLAQQVKLLEEKIEEVSSTIDVTELKQQVSDLSEKVTETGDAGELKTRVQKVEQTLTDLSKLGTDGSDNTNQLAGIAAIASKLNKIEARVNADINSIKTEFKKSLRREVEQVSKAVAEQETLTQLESVKLKTDTLGKKLATLDAQSSKLVTDLDGLKSIIDGVKGDSISSTKLGSELAPLRSALSQIDEKIALLSKREAEALESARRSALAIALSNLKRGMDRGDGFSAELQAVEQLAGSDVDFSSFNSIRETGVPNEQDLLKAFPELAIQALAKGTTNTDGSSWETLVSKARTAFKYRRTGDVQGESAEAILARMEHKFKDGHVEDVVKEAEALEGQAKQVIAPWLKQVKARLFIETEMHNLEDKLLLSLSPKT